MSLLRHNLHQLLLQKIPSQWYVSFNLVDTLYTEVGTVKAFMDWIQVPWISALLGMCVLHILVGSAHRDAPNEIIIPVGRKLLVLAVSCTCSQVLDLYQSIWFSGQLSSRINYVSFCIMIWLVSSCTIGWSCRHWKWNWKLSWLGDGSDLYGWATSPDLLKCKTVNKWMFFLFFWLLEIFSNA